MKTFRAALFVVTTLLAPAAMGGTGLVEKQSKGLRLVAGFVEDAEWIEAFRRSSPTPRLRGATELTPDGFASLALLYTGPALTRPGFALLCGLNVVDEQGRRHEMAPQPCTAPGQRLDADKFYPTALTLEFEGERSQVGGVARVTIFVTEVASGNEMRMEVALPVAAGDSQQNARAPTPPRRAGP
jgi:hypothetical protein